MTKAFVRHGLWPVKITAYTQYDMMENVFNVLGWPAGTCPTNKNVIK